MLWKKLRILRVWPGGGVENVVYKRRVIHHRDTEAQRRRGAGDGMRVTKI